MIPAVASLLAALLLATIPAQLHLDTRRAWAETMDREHDAAYTDEPEAVPAAVVETPEPAALLPRRTPILEPQDDEQIGRPPTELVERLLAGLKRDDTGWPWSACTVPLEPGLDHAWRMTRPEQTDAGAYRPRHARGPETPTEEFAAIVDAHLGDLATWCTLCEAGDHGDCPGCACPCGMPAVVESAVAR